MSPGDALKIVLRQHPCPHDNADTSLGNGKIWAKCDDCGATFQQDGWERARKASKAFDEAIECLCALVEQHKVST